MLFNRWVDVFESQNHSEVAALDSYLKGHGIRSQIKTTSQGIPAGMIISSKVRVRQKDEIRAQSLIAEYKQ